MVTLLTFSFLHMVPGDPIDILGGESMDEAGREQLRQQYGLDRPVLLQYGYWLIALIQGDLGTSIRTARPVLDEVMSRTLLTVALAVLSILLSVVIGVVGGAIAARFRDSWIDRAVMAGSTVAMSIPNFFMATL